jgi:peptidoglycan/xylan/chitin deacetylase (PgdA/CDA1 family)
VYVPLNLNRGSIARKKLYFLLSSFLFILFYLLPSTHVSANKHDKLLDTVNLYETQIAGPEVGLSPKVANVVETLENIFKIRKIELLEETPYYVEKDIGSRKLSSLTPKEVVVVNQEEEYFLVKTAFGEHWIKPTKYIDETGELKLLLDRTYSIFETDSIRSKTGETVSPQLVTLVDDTADWWKIKHESKEKYLYKREGQKVAYLTFDDGPNQYTDDILRILNDYNAKATFFMLEPSMRYYPELVKQMKNEGHYTALHSVTHNRYKLYNGDPFNPALEMEQGRKTLKSITGEDHYLVRMPYGSIPFMHDSFRDALVEYNFKMWDWSIDTYDWKYNTSSYWNIVANVENNLAYLESHDEPVVILLHDRVQTVKALPHILELLYSEGYELVPYNPENHIVVNFWEDSRL